MSKEVKTITPDRKIDLPELSKKHGLMYLLYRLGSLDRAQVESLAYQFYADTKTGNVRSLKEICRAAGLVGEKELEKDAFLNHVALSYSAEDMERTYSFEAPPKNGISRSIVDTFAGSGPPRPLIKELYSLESLRLAVVEGDGFSEVFKPTNGARALSDALKIVYEGQKWGGALLVIRSRTDREVRESSQGQITKITKLQ